MACGDDGKAGRLTLRDVALAALELDADGRRESVSWDDIITKARAMAAERTQPSAQIKEGGQANG